MVYKGRSARNVDAQLNLAIPYYEGTGVEQSNAKTAEWLKKAADQGDAKARRLLDEMAVSGLMSAI